MNYLLVLVNEKVNMMLGLKKYWYQTVWFMVSRTLLISAVYIGVSRSVSSDVLHLVLDEILVGYVFWIYASLVYVSALNTIQVAGSNGFVQQMFVSSVPFGLIITIRAMAYLLYTIGLTILLAVIAMLMIEHWLRTDYSVLLVVLLLSTPSVLGVGFIICGLRLQVSSKYVSSINLVMGIGLFLVCVSNVDAIAPEALNVLPFFPAIHLARELVSRQECFQIAQLTPTIINSFCYFVVGVFIYRYLEKMAKEKDVIGKY
ncbi:MAG: hypothetical protein COA78_04040 [Blastopirellula sp.]|nr:MAG: hypothetical protein COA78_04040 [Blastopirellula sp.]